MKRILLINFLLVIWLLSPIYVLSQVSFSETGVAPAPSAMLDISSTTKGLLLPRMTSAQRSAIAGGTPPNGLMVWQTSAPAGIWYYDANIPGWTNAFVGSQPWELQGNTGTSSATQFLGTTNNVPLIFRTNATELARFTNVGRMGINTVGPVEVLEVDGGINITNTAAANTEGAIQWDAANSFHEGNVDGTATGWYPLENVFQEENPAQWAEVISTCSSPPSGYVQIGAGTGTTVGTLESPYGTNWEDHKVQFLWLATELMTAGICPNEDITGVALNATSAGTFPMFRAKMGMVQTTTADLISGLEPGVVNLWSSASHTHTNGWNQYVFNSPFQWNGTSNLIVEYSFDNCEWQSNRHIRTDITPHHALYGIYCDACGGTGYNTCIVTSCIECPGLPCRCGVVGGNDLDNNTNLITCTNCSFPGGTIGSKAAVKKRAQVRFYAQTGTSVINTYQDKMIFYNGGLLIGNAAWAAAGGPIPTPYSFRGPGTISGQNSVWGGSVELNDHVFDYYFDERPIHEDTDRTNDYIFMPLDEMVNYVELERHLPSFEGREEWNTSGTFSLDKLSNQLWVTVEEQALYIKELNERMKLLQEHLIEKKLRELK